MRSNGIKANKRYFHSQDILDPKKNNKQMINSLKNFTNQSNQTFSKTNNFFPKYKYNNIFTSYNNINDYLPLRFKSSIIKSQNNLTSNFSECDKTDSSQSLFSNFNKNINLTNYQFTSPNKRKKNINVPIIKLENKNYLYSEYVPYDKKKIFEIRNKIHNYLTSEFQKNGNSINNSINIINNNNSNIVKTSKLINYINDSKNIKTNELSNNINNEKKKE